MKTLLKSFLILITFIGHHSFSQFSFLGDGVLLNDSCVELTDASNYQSGWVFSTEKFKLNEDDSLEFNVFVGNNDAGADGMVFMLHNDPRGLAAQGCVGEGLGYADHPSGSNSIECNYGTRSKITPSIAVEFDTYRNSGQGDPIADHLAYLENGSVNHGVNYYSTPNIEDNKTHKFKLVWDFSEKKLSVYFDNKLAFTRVKDLSTTIFGGKTSAYWGFSASTGGANNQHYFCTINEKIAVSINSNASAKSGNYNDPTTWLVGVPTLTDKAIILADHEVTLTTNTDIGSVKIEKDGILNLNNKRLRLTDGDLEVHGDITNPSRVDFTGSNQKINNSTEITLKNVFISSTGTVSITNKPVIITNWLNHRRGTLITNDSLIMDATPTSSAYIRELPTSGSIVGKVTMRQYIYTERRLWRYFSSPMIDATVADFQRHMPITGKFSDPSTGPGIKSTSPSMYEYNAVQGWLPYPTSGTAASNAVVPGKGYSIYQRDNIGRSQYLEINGTPNQGTVVLNLENSNTGVPENDGWNLIGNPYPSPISWSNMGNNQLKNVNDAIYIKDNDIDNPIEMAFVDGIATPSSFNGYISPFQSFWVKANGNNPSITFEENDKINASAEFFRPLSVSDSLIRIRLTDGNKVDETVIRFAGHTTLAFDNNKDAYQVSQGTPTISTLSSNKEKLNINSFDLNTEPLAFIPLTFSNLVSNTIQLDFFQIGSAFSNYEVVLVDQVENTLTNIHLEPIVNITINGNSENRFVLAFSPNQVITSKEKTQNSKTTIYPTINNGIDLNVMGINEESELAIIDISGKIVHSQTINEDISINFDTQLINGSYTCIITSSNYNYKSKFIVNQND